MLIFRCPAWITFWLAGRCWELMLIFQLPSHEFDWKRWSASWLKMFENRPVTQSSRRQTRRCQYGHQCSNVLQGPELLEFNQFKCNFRGLFITGLCIILTYIHISQAAGLFLSVLGFSKLSKVVSWAGSTLAGEGCSKSAISAASLNGSIGLISLVCRLAKRFFCQNPRAQVDILSSFSAIEKSDGRKYVFLKIRPSEVVFPSFPSFPGIILMGYWFLFV